MQKQHSENQAQSVPMYSLIWIILAWAIAWVVGSRIAVWRGGLYYGIFSLRDTNHQFLFSSIGWGITGLIGGTITGAVYFSNNLLEKWKSVLSIGLGWLFAGGIHGWIARVVLRGIVTNYGGQIIVSWADAAQFAIFGLIGGLITAFVLVREKIISSDPGVVFIPLGWAAGWFIGINTGCEFLGRTCSYHDDNDILWHAMGGVIASLIGGLVTNVMINNNRRKTEK